ncbi:MAG: C25 family cysteine peptidase [Kiritimatiellia bacterium]
MFVLFVLAAFRPCGGSEREVLLYTPSASVSLFEASALKEDGRVLLHWQTTVELGVEAFRVLRQRKGGVPEPVGSGYVRSIGDETGGAYTLPDEHVTAGETVRYDLLMLSAHGPDQSVANWAGIIGTAPDPQPRLAAIAAPAETPRIQATPAPVWIGSGDRVRNWTNSLPADRVRLSLRNEGVYRVSAQEIAAAAGWELASVTAALAATNLSMSCQGDPVAWHGDGDALLFHGVPAASRFAPENVYWLAWGPGSNMTRRVLTPDPPAITNDFFVNQIVRQGTDYLARVSYSSLTDAPAPYVAFQPGPLLAGAVKQFNEFLTNCAPGVWTGAVTVNLLSLYEVGTDAHTARVAVGGTPVGESSWSGEQAVSLTYPFSSTNLAGSAAALSVANVTATPENSTDYTRFLCISYAFSYPSLYRARNDALRCTGGTGNTAAVSGFTSNDVIALDVTVPNQPALMEPVTFTYDSVAGNWTAAFSCGGSGQVYQVCSKSAGTLQPAVRGVRDVDWASPENAADYVILIPPEAWRAGFRSALQPLADFRNAQGLRTRIVDVEALYDHYSFGLVDPLAIRAFCGSGSTNWAERPLRYVLLAGAGALDFKHQRLSVNDYTACLIPTLIAGQRFSTGEGMTVALDAALGDGNGDGVPEVAIGRLPTTKTQDVALVVRKTIAYEGALLWKQQASIAADWDNTGIMYYPFSVGTDRLLAPLIQAGRTVTNHYPINNTGNLVPVRVNSLFPALNAGSGIFHYFGHANEVSLGGSNDRLLYTNNISTDYWQKPTIAILIGCRPNRWQSLTTTVCIMPYGLFAADTGFVAGLGATGYTVASESEKLAVSLYSAAAEASTLRLGDMLRRGQRSMAGAIPPERLLCYSLVGDPALVVRHDITALGTSVPWLAQHGQSAPNADLADPDFDGWPTWQEYGADTDPTNGELRIKAAHLEKQGRGTIAFEGDANRLYALEYKFSLLATDDWQAVSWSLTNATEWTSPETAIRPQGPVTTVEMPTGGISTQGFYRIRGWSK